MLKPGGVAVFAEPILFGPDWIRNFRHGKLVTRWIPSAHHTPDERSFTREDLDDFTRAFAQQRVRWRSSSLGRVQNLVWWEMSPAKGWSRLERIDHFLLDGFPGTDARSLDSSSSPCEPADAAARSFISRLHSRKEATAHDHTDHRSSRHAGQLARPGARRPRARRRRDRHRPQQPDTVGRRAVRTLSELDVRNRDAVQETFAKVKPDFLVHLAAETELELSDADQDHAYLTNTIATKYLAIEAGQADIPIVYISTAGVFDGVKETPYTEFDAPNPINTYGDSKFEGEKYVRDFCDRYFVIRAGWMVGGGAGKDHKFVAKMLNQIRDGKTTLHAVGDKLGTPTYTPDFARTFLGLIDSGLYGLYHMACEGEGSRYDVTAADPPDPRTLGPDRAGRGRLGLLRRAVSVQPASERDHAQHGAGPPGHEPDAALEGRTRGVPPRELLGPVGDGGIRSTP